MSECSYSHTSPTDLPAEVRGSPEYDAALTLANWRSNFIIHRNLATLARMAGRPSEAAPHQRIANDIAAALHIDVTRKSDGLMMRTATGITDFMSFWEGVRWRFTGKLPSRSDNLIVAMIQCETARGEHA